MSLWENSNILANENYFSYLLVSISKAFNFESKKTNKTPEKNENPQIASPKTKLLVIPLF